MRVSLKCFHHSSSHFKGITLPRRRYEIFNIEISPALLISLLQASASVLHTTHAHAKLPTRIYHCAERTCRWSNYEAPKYCLLVQWCHTLWSMRPNTWSNLANYSRKKWLFGAAAVVKKLIKSACPFTASAKASITRALSFSLNQGQRKNNALRPLTACPDQRIALNETLLCEDSSH